MQILEPFERADGVLDRLGGDGCIASGRGELGMPQQDLDHPHVGPSFQQMRGEAVAQGNRRTDTGKTEEWMMTNATFTLENGPQLEGEIIDTGGDYIRLRTSTHMTQEQLDQYGERQIEIDGKSERVLLESVLPDTDDDEAFELTMRRFQPSA